jgi:signal transduction histidine kinase
VTMKSIRIRLLVNFIFIVIVTVIILEALIIDIVRQNYYKNLEDNLYNQIKMSADFYERYFSHSTLRDNVLNNIDTFWRQTSAQVQILDKTGKLLMDSIGIIPIEGSKDLIAEDIQQALKGNKGSWVGKVSYDDERVMAVSYPLKSGETIEGVLRFVTSLRQVHEDVDEIAKVFILIGAAVVIISCAISVFQANAIVSPLHEVIRAAKIMAMGDYSVRSKKISDDEIGKLSDVLNHMAKEIVKKDKLKNEFISSVSHELRTPLTSIKGWAVTLKSGDIEDKDTLLDGLEIIEKESDRLTSMVEELLDFSRFVSGKITLSKSEVSIPKLMTHIKKQLTPRARRENVKFEVSFDNCMHTLYTDENRLKQVFINILDNSFKFTPAGGRVSFTGKSIDDKAIFSIKDTGCGISSGDLPRVKEKFYKGMDSKSRNGIGLSICDEIIKLMEGCFEIKSEPGKGTEVLIALPLKEGGVA